MKRKTVKTRTRKKITTDRRTRRPAEEIAKTKDKIFEGLKQGISMTDLAGKYDVNVTQISTWNRKRLEQERKDTRKKKVAVAKSKSTTGDRKKKVAAVAKRMTKLIKTSIAKPDVVKKDRVKINMTIDADLLRHIRKVAEKKQIGYQTLINQVLRENVQNKEITPLKDFVKIEVEDQISKLLNKLRG